MDKDIVGLDDDLVVATFKHEAKKDRITGEIFDEEKIVFSPTKMPKHKSRPSISGLNQTNSNWKSINNKTLVPIDESLTKQNYVNERNKINKVASVSGIYITSKPVKHGHVGLNKVNPIHERIM